MKHHSGKNLKPGLKAKSFYYQQLLKKMSVEEADRMWYKHIYGYYPEDLWGYKESKRILTLKF